jgi:hypothetical protein
VLGVDRLSRDTSTASRREFTLYWVGFLIVVLAAVSILMTISGVLIDVLSYRCWYPILSPLLGVNESTEPTQAIGVPYYCENPMVAVIRFVFNFLAGLVFVGAGFYMMMNGRKN